MNNPFIAKSDTQICVLFYNVMKEEYETLQNISYHIEHDTPMWNDDLQYTLIGKLFIEIIERDIDRDFFELVVAVFLT